MGIKGSFTDFHPIEVLQLIKENSQSGILLVSYEDGYIGMYFIDGNLVFAFKANKMYDIFTKRVITKFIEAIKNRDKETFNQMLREMKNILSVFFSLRDGAFSFEEVTFFKDKEIAKYALATERLIMSEAKKLDDEEVINRKISSMEMVFEKSRNFENILRNLQLDVNDYKVLDAVDGRKSVREIIESTGLPEGEVKRILYGFLCAGVIRRSPPKIKREKLTLFPIELIKKLINKIKGL